ncbi:MAG: ComEC/Rec2 family competence protein, partial [Beijerinckiaceae bacterium]
MRNLAIAAIIVLLLEPETVMGPSFQMSFAAVAALIAGAEWHHAHRSALQDGPADWFSRATRHAWLLVAGMLATTLLATLATAPFAAYHFQRLNPLGLIGNAAALPFVSLIVMPAAVAGVLLWPLALDMPVWWLMGQGAGPVIGISKAIASMYGAVRAVTAFGAGAILLMALALCWVTLWRTWIRWFAAIFATAGLVMAMRTVPADMFIDRGGYGAAYRTADGTLAIIGQPSAFTVSFWLQAAGDLRRATDPSLKAPTRCDLLGCTGTDAGGRIIAWVKDRRAFPEDCGRASLIITLHHAPDWCTEPMVADRTTLSAYGSMAIRWQGDLPQLAGTRSPTARRPWQPPLASAQPSPNTAPPIPAAGRQTVTTISPLPSSLPDSSDDMPPLPDDAPPVQ